MGTSAIWKKLCARRPDIAAAFEIEGGVEEVIEEEAVRSYELLKVKLFKELGERGPWQIPRGVKAAILKNGAEVYPRTYPRTRDRNTQQLGATQRNTRGCRHGSFSPCVSCASGDGGIFCATPCSTGEGGHSVRQSVIENTCLFAVPDPYHAPTHALASSCRFAMHPPHRARSMCGRAA